MSVLTTASIKVSEESAVAGGAFSFRELMYRAGNGAAEIISDKIDCSTKKIAVICGSGNNGGDGCVAAETLYKKGFDVTVITPLGKPRTENALFFYNALPEEIVKTDTVDREYDIIIEALFGIGLNRDLNDDINSLLKRLNGMNAVRVAIDIPAGIEADTGKLLGTPFAADYTVTFIALKPCLLLPPASDFCGDITVCDIGVKPVNKDFSVIHKPHFEKRRHNSHKGSYGTALMFCGSYGMAGAAVLSARAAMRSGLGIAKCVVCEGIYSAFTASLSEAVCIPVRQSEYGTYLSSNIDIAELSRKCQAVLFGCGVNISPDNEKILERLLAEINIPLVIDADGINLLSRRIELLRKSKAPVILTPHPAEMARLCGKTVNEVEADRIGVAKRFSAEHGCTVVLKGANTLVAEPNGAVSFNITGNPGMATAGSGDVLVGITVSLAAQGLSPTAAAKAAVYLHGLAGDKAAARRSRHALIASDIIEEL